MMYDQKALEYFAHDRAKIEFFAVENKPRFLQEVPVIEKSDALQVARQLDLPGITGQNEEKDALIGLMFCRGRKITPQEALNNPHYREEVAQLPRNVDQLIEYFSHRTKEQVQKDLEKSQVEQAQLDQDCLQLERVLVKEMGIEVPAEIMTLDEYCTWVAQNAQHAYLKPFTPSGVQLEALRFEFRKNYAGMIGDIYHYYDLDAHWHSLVKSIVYDKKYRKHSFYGAYLDTINLKHRTDLLNNSYKEDALLFHTTSLQAALGIVVANHFISGHKLQGISFSADGLTVPMLSQDSVAFVAQYGQLRETGAAPFPEMGHDYEREVRYPGSLSTDAIIGVVPYNTTLFPKTLAESAAGFTITGEVVQKWQQNYEEIGALMTPEDLEEVKDAVHSRNKAEKTQNSREFSLAKILRRLRRNDA